MFKDTIESIVNDLIQLDIDATYAYDEAISAIVEIPIKQQLKDFRGDHERHIRELSAALKDIDGKPIKKTQDFKGYVIEGVTKLRSIMGTTSALKAMLTNEKITNKKYTDALEYHGFTSEIRQLIAANTHDEKRHLEYIKTTIQELETTDA